MGWTHPSVTSGVNDLRQRYLYEEVSLCTLLHLALSSAERVNRKWILLFKFKATSGDQTMFKVRKVLARNHQRYLISKRGLYPFQEGHDYKIVRQNPGEAWYVMELAGSQDLTISL